MQGTPQKAAEEFDFSGKIEQADMAVLLAQNDQPEVAELVVDLLYRFNGLSEAEQFARITQARSIIQAAKDAVDAGASLKAEKEQSP